MILRYKKIRKITLLVLIFFMFMPSVYAGKVVIKDVFKQTPDSILPYLTKNNKLDFIDFCESNMKAEVKNSYDETCVMTDLTDDFLHLGIGNEVNVDMKILPVSDSTFVVCMIKTYAGPEKESEIRFYDDGWKLLPLNKYIALPSFDNLVKKPDSLSESDFNNIKEIIYPHLIVAKLSKKDAVMTLSLSLPLLNNDDKKKAERIILQKNIRWNNNIFK